MILHWKAVAMDEFQAEWQGMLLVLGRENKTWRVFIAAVEPGATLAVNGQASATTRQRWATARQAMEAVDLIMNRLVRLAVKSQRARQGAPSFFTSVGHLGSSKPNFSRRVAEVTRVARA